MEASLQERIAERAYELYQKRGKQGSGALQDWLDAERQVTEEVQGTQTHAQARESKKTRRATKPRTQTKAPRATKHVTTKKTKSSPS